MTKYSNAISVVHHLLKSLGVKHSKSGLRQKLEDHPDYPSMMAIKDCLTEYWVANEARNIAKEDYTACSLPFIAQLTPNGGSYICVTSFSEQHITYSNEKHSNALMPKGEFLEKWSGIVLLAEANEDSIEPNCIANKWKDRAGRIKIPLLVASLLAGVFLAINHQTATLPYYILLAINAFGVAVTSLLLVTSIDNNNPLVQNLCSLGSKNGCNAILKTDAAKLTNWLSWSEVGFFYFTGSGLSLLFAPSSLSILAWLNLLALPYTFYSIGYQYKYKNWCVLCCAVQGLLVLQGLTLALSAGEGTQTVYLSAFNFSRSTINLIPSPLYLFFSFLLPVVIWYALKPFFQQYVQIEPLKQQLKKFKYNSELFSQILKNQPHFAVGDEMMPVVLGNPDAETVITMVSNPFCGPCATVHKTIDEWLQQRNDLQLKIIFTTADHDDDERTKVSRHISALTTLNDKMLVEKALNDWYAQNSKKYDNWAKKYPVNFNGEQQSATEKQKQWCDMADINFTPTILVNGHKLPEPYRLEDIKYLIA